MLPKPETARLASLLCYHISLWPAEREAEPAETKRKMIIRCELNIRPESRKRIEEKLCTVTEDEDVLSFNFIENKNIIEKK